MTIKDANGVMLILQTVPYRDCLEFAAYGLSLAIVRQDQAVGQFPIEEQDAIQIVFDLAEKDTVDRTIGELQYWCNQETLQVTLTDEDEIFECSFVGVKYEALAAWFNSYMTFVIHRLNATDCLLPNQTARKTEYTVSQN